MTNDQPQQTTDELEAEVDAKFMRLNALGLGVPDVAILNLKVEVLTSLVLGEDRIDEYKRTMLSEMSRMLDMTLAEVKRQQSTSTFVQPNKTLIVPGR